MKRLIVMCMALALAFAPAATADAAKRGKGKSGAAKTCVVKKSLKGKKGKKARKACAKKKKATKKAAVDPQVAAAEKECRADRRIDAEGFAADFGTAKDAVAKCAAELLEQQAGEEPLDEEESFDGEDVAEDEVVADEPEPTFQGEDAPAGDEELV